MVQGWVADLMAGFAENGSRPKSAKEPLVWIPVCCRKWLKAEIGNCVMGVSCAVLRRCVIVRYGIAENSLELKSAKLLWIFISTDCRNGP